jgi:hypothetical protein
MTEKTEPENADQSSSGLVGDEIRWSELENSREQFAPKRKQMKPEHRRRRQQQIKPARP